MKESQIANMPIPERVYAISKKKQKRLSDGNLSNGDMAVRTGTIGAITGIPSLAATILFPWLWATPETGVFVLLPLTASVLIVLSSLVAKGIKVEYGDYFTEGSYMKKVRTPISSEEWKKSNLWYLDGFSAIRIKQKIHSSYWAAFLNPRRLFSSVPIATTVFYDPRNDVYLKMKYSLGLFSYKRESESFGGTRYAFRQSLGKLKGDKV